MWESFVDFDICHRMVKLLFFISLKWYDLEQKCGESFVDFDINLPLNGIILKIVLDDYDLLLQVKIKKNYNSEMVRASTKDVEIFYRFLHLLYNDVIAKIVLVLSDLDLLSECISETVRASAKMCANLFRICRFFNLPSNGSLGNLYSMTSTYAMVIKKLYG